MWLDIKKKIHEKNIKVYFIEHNLNKSNLDWPGLRPRSNLFFFFFELNLT
jgi:hypothetical protein